MAEWGEEEMLIAFLVACEVAVLAYYALPEKGNMLGAYLLWLGNMAILLYAINREVEPFAKILNRLYGRG